MKIFRMSKPPRIAEATFKHADDEVRNKTATPNCSILQPGCAAPVWWMNFTNASGRENTYEAMARKIH